MVWKPDYATAVELRNYARITSTADDVQLGFAVTASSRAIDRHTHRQFGKVDAPELRRYTARWSRSRGRWVVRIDDLMTETGLVVQVDAGEITDYRLEPVNAAEEGKPWERLVIDPGSPVQPTGEEYEVQNIAEWGWSSVPDAVKNATLLQGNRVHARRFSPYGVAGSPDTGSELRLLAKLDPDVAVTLGDYVRDPVVFA